MHKQIVVTDLTRMRDSDVCLAGVELKAPHHCIRPLLVQEGGYRTRHPDEQWLHSGAGGPVRLFSLVSFDALVHAPRPPHTEDWSIPVDPPQVGPVMGGSEKRALLETLQQPAIDDLFGASISWNQDLDGLRSGGCVEPNSGTASLGTLHAQFHGVTASLAPSGRIDYRAFFSDSKGTYNKLKITDLSFMGWANALRDSHGGSNGELNRSMRAVFHPNLEVWLRIGLARPYAASHRSETMCYLQITGVHTFPDYLDGASWFDFAGTHA